jgi:hypothetical protein
VKLYTLFVDLATPSPMQTIQDYIKPLLAALYSLETEDTAVLAISGIAIFLLISLFFSALVRLTTARLPEKLLIMLDRPF